MNTYTSAWKVAKTKAELLGLTIVEQGWEQHVIIDEPAKLVYRYPRHAAAAAKLADEVQVLEMLHTQTWSIQIPRIREFHVDYSVYDYIIGDVLSAEILAAMSKETIISIGHSIGGFLAELHQCDLAIIDTKKTKQTMSLATYYSQRIKRSTPPESIKTKALRHLDNLKNSPFDDQVVVHGDLHGLNIVLDPFDKRISGIIDFSEIEIGDPHQDFRKLYMTDARLLEPAIEGYRQHNGQPIDRQRVITWAKVNEWSNVCYFWGQDTQVTYMRAARNLVDWGELS